VVSNSERLAITRLDQDTRAIMSLVTGDLHRAGYWGILPNLTNDSSNIGLTQDTDTGDWVPDKALNTKVPGVILNQTLRLVRCADNRDDDGNKDANGNYVLDGDCLDWGDPLIPDDVRYQAIITAANTSGLKLSFVTTTENFVLYELTSIPTGGWQVINPFAAVTIGSSDDCILFTYDRNEDGLLDDDEKFGYRLRENVALQIVKVNDDDDATCTDDDDDKENWQDLNDVNIVEVTDFQINDLFPEPTPPISSRAFKVAIRELQIVITAQLTKDNDAERTIEETVRIRNEQFD